MAALYLFFLVRDYSAANIIIEFLSIYCLYEKNHPNCLSLPFSYQL